MIKNRKMKLSESWKSLWWYDNMQRKQLNGNVIWETTRACRNILMIVNWGFPNGFQAMDMTILLRNAYLPLPGHYTRYVERGRWWTPCLPWQRRPGSEMSRKAHNLVTRTIKSFNQTFRERLSHWELTTMSSCGYQELAWGKEGLIKKHTKSK